MMPNNGGRTESQRPAFLLQAPADINVITRHPELRIKAANRLQRRHTKSHIASWNMFRFTVGQQNMDRPAGSMRDAIRNHTITRRCNIRAANTGEGLPGGIQKSRDK